jgi:molecular chaperone DnaK
VDANGILNVSAKDKGTGKEQKIRIEASSGLTEDEINRMRDEAKANEEADKAEKEKIEKVNSADTTIFTTEKQLKEYGDKLSADNKSNIESALAELKTAHQAKDVAEIDAGLAKLNAAWEAASQELYAATQNAEAQAGAQDAAGNNAAGPGSSAEGEVTDVNFEEVK